MRGFLRRIGPATLLAVGMILGPALARQDAPKQEPPKADSKDSKAGKDKPFSSKTTHFTAKLLIVKGAQRYITVEVTRKIPQQNAQNAVNLANLQLQLLTSKDPSQIANIKLDMA